jgi:glycerol-3-phosphate dehydrogenase
MVGQDVDIELGKGSIIVFAHRMVSRAVNRCRPPASYDIIVPTGTVSLFGTTSEVVDDPDVTDVRPEEIQALLDNAEDLIPGIRRYRAFRAWAGVRPLYRPPGWSSGTPLPRRHAVVDHARFGLAGFYTVCGGSLTTHRSMAEDLGNVVCASLGLNTPCRSSTTPLAGAGGASDWRPAQGYYEIEGGRRYRAPVCECESIDMADVARLIAGASVKHLHDVRRRLRVGFGPCQGTFCGPRVAAMIKESDPSYAAAEDLVLFWAERMKGSRHVAWGTQARQMLLGDLVYRQTLGLRLTPEVTGAEGRR